MASKTKKVTDRHPTFSEVFREFYGNVESVHGSEVAESYRTLREQEAAAVQSAHSFYPTAEEQMQEFLSFRIEDVTE